MNECAGEIDFAVGKAKCNRQKSMSIQLLMCLEENQSQIFLFQKYFFKNLLQKRRCVNLNNLRFFCKEESLSFDINSKLLRYVKRFLIEYALKNVDYNVCEVWES